VQCVTHEGGWVLRGYKIENHTIIWYESLLNEGNNIHKISTYSNGQLAGSPTEIRSGSIATIVRIPIRGFLFTTAWSVSHNADREGYHPIRMYLQVSIRGLSKMGTVPPQHGR
jgi:hypothetical protein